MIIFWFKDVICNQHGVFRAWLLCRTKGYWRLGATLFVLTGCGGGGGSGSGGDPAQPVASPNNYDVNAGATLTVDHTDGVLSNDSDPQGLPLSAVLVDDVNRGNLTLKSDGSFQYDHTDSGVADDSFTYKATNGNQDSNVVTVTLVVNAPPEAGDSCDKVGLNPAILSGDLSALVSDPKGDTVFTYSVTQQGAKGFTSVNSSTGQFSYTPDPGARGVDSFTYEARDALGATDTGTFKLVIGKTRIMPLGDSITAGITGPASGEPPDPADRIGYRKKLYNDLVAAGFEVDFVGSQQGGQNQGIADPDHEGHPGKRDDDLADATSALWVRTLLTSNPADIVLLHIGSNDVNVNPADVDADEVSKILQDIDDWEALNNPVTVFLAQITDRETQFFSFPSPYSPNTDVVTFNNNVTQVANTRINNGDDIVIVDQFNALSYPNNLTLGDNGLRVHPTPGTNGGYEKMANTWFNALSASGKIPKCP